MDTVVVTGCSGYIGGQTLLLLHDVYGKNINVIGIDLRPLPDNLKNFTTNFIQSDFSDISTLEFIRTSAPRALVHCAASSIVGPSIQYPSKYYDNNYVKTKILIDYLIEHNLKTKFIFSSTAAVYGDSPLKACSETVVPNPISPYGESKLMVEYLLRSYNRAYNTNYIAFRYFNACGADPFCRHGPDLNGTHIMGMLLKAILNNSEFNLYGTNYDTKDGSGVRDYVHVEDIARAHVIAIFNSVPSGIYNLGKKVPITNLELIDLVQKITKKKLNISYKDSRHGDIAELTAISDKFDSMFKWSYHNIQDMVRHTWNWYNKCK